MCLGIVYKQLVFHLPKQVREAAGRVTAMRVTRATPPPPLSSQQSPTDSLLEGKTTPLFPFPPSVFSLAQDFLSLAQFDGDV